MGSQQIDSMRTSSIQVARVLGFVVVLGVWMAPGFDGGLEKYQVEPRSGQLLKHGGI